MGATELRGRDRERDTLTAAADAARAGAGSMLLVHGEAGIGKTRLLDELHEHGERTGMHVCRGRCEELEQGRPFGALIEALGVPDALPDAQPGTRRAADQRFLVQDAFVEQIDRLGLERPTILAVDDLQWADSATLSTLGALARRSADLGILLVLAFRPTPHPDELAELVARCRDLGAGDVALGPITDEAIGALAGDVVGGALPDDLMPQLRATAGNPFLVIELSSSYDADDSLVDLDDADAEARATLPVQLRGSLLHRLTPLGSGTREMLSIASVLDGSGRLEDLASMQGVTLTDAEHAVAEATRAGLLEPGAAGVKFRHDLIRQAVYEDLPEVVRAGWHREAARRLGAWADPTVVAQHLMLGATVGDDETIAALRTAAAGLEDTAPSVAAVLLERACSLTRDDSERVELAVECARVLLEVGRAEDAQGHAERALALPRGSPRIRARARYIRGRALSFEGRFGEGRVGLEEALAAEELDAHDRAMALAACAQTCVFTLAFDEALALAADASAVGAPLALTEALVDADLARCMVHAFRSEFPASLAAGREAIASTEADPRAPSNNTMVAFALLAADRLEEARAVLESGRRLAIERGDGLSLPSQQSTLGFVLFAMGEWDAALAEIDVAVALAEDYGLLVSDQLGHSIQANVAFHRGDLDVAGSLLHASRDEQHRGGMAPRILWARVSALLREAEGDVAGAAAALHELFDLGRALGIDAVGSMGGVECARMVVAAGDRDAAAMIESELAGYAVRADTPTARGSAAYARGLLDRDGAVLGTAAQEFVLARRPLQGLRALEAAGDAYAATGLHDDAVARLGEALAIADALGAAHDARRISASMRALGVRFGSEERRTRARHGWDALTGAEREVASLVADGLRNPEIADRLYVSRRTVEGHIAHLYRKLEAKTRVGLAGVIRDRIATAPG